MGVERQHRQLGSVLRRACQLIGEVGDRRELRGRGVLRDARHAAQADDGQLGADRPGDIDAIGGPAPLLEEDEGPVVDDIQNVAVPFRALAVHDRDPGGPLGILEHPVVARQDEHAVDDRFGHGEVHPLLDEAAEFEQ